MFKIVTVMPLLANYIKDIRIISDSAQSATPYKVYPSLFAVLGFQYRGRLNVLNNEGESALLKCCGITGLLKTYKRFQTTDASTISILFRFFPWAIPALFSLPAHTLSNQSLGLEDILKEKILDYLQEKIQSAPDPYSAANLIQEFFVQLHSMQNNKFILHARIINIAQQLADNPIEKTIAQLANQYGYSKRSLERYFQELVGLSPKRFALTARFQQVLSMLQITNDWEQIAVHFRYFDQAHFIKDFKQFSGILPSQLTHPP